MIVTCPSCTTRYLVADSKLGESGRMVRCARCAHTWYQEREIANAAANPPEPEPEDIRAPAAPEPAPAVAEQGPAPDPEPDVDETESTAAPPPADRDTSRRRDRPRTAARATKSGAAGRSNLPAPRRKVRLGSAVGWAALVLFVVGIGAGGFFGRAQIEQFWPATKSAYALLDRLNAEDNVAGLEFRNLQQWTAEKDGVAVLNISGDVINITGVRQSVPRIRIGLLNESKKEIYSWTTTSNISEIAPGDKTSFIAKLDNPPPAAAEYEVGFLLDELKGGSK